MRLTQEEYQEGTNEQVYLMSKEEWKSIFDNLDAQGENSKSTGFFQKIHNPRFYDLSGGYSFSENEI